MVVAVVLFLLLLLLLLSYTDTTKRNRLVVARNHFFFSESKILLVMQSYTNGVYAEENISRCESLSFGKVNLSTHNTYRCVMYVYVSETELCSYTQCMLEKTESKAPTKGRRMCMCLCTYVSVQNESIKYKIQKKREKIEISSLWIPATQKLKSALTFYEIRFSFSRTRTHMHIVHCTNSLICSTHKRTHNADMGDLKTSEYVMLNLLDVAFQTYDDVNNSEMKIGRRNWRRRQRARKLEGARRDWVRFKKKNERLRTCANTNWSSADFSIFRSDCYFFYSFFVVFESFHTYTSRRKTDWNFLDACATKTLP